MTHSLDSLPGVGERFVRGRSHVSGRPESPCSSCDEVVYRAWWFVTAFAGYDRVSRDVRRSQGRTAGPGGGLWSRSAWPSDAESRRHVGSVTAAGRSGFEAGRGCALPVEVLAANRSSIVPSAVASGGVVHLVVAVAA
jgi:hypothetical protein